MKKEVLDLVDLNTPERYALSIRLASDGFCFSLYDRLGNGKVIPFYYKCDIISSELANIKGAFGDMSELLGCNFSDVNVILDTDRVIAVPGKMLDDEDIKAAYSSCFDLLPGEMLLHSVLKKNNSVFVFSINKYVKQFLDESLGEINWLPSVAAVTNHCSLLQTDGKHKRMFVYVTCEKMLVVAFNESELLYANVFECDSDDDRLFYIMNVWKTVSLSQSEDILSIVSDKVETRNLERRLGNYIAEVMRMERNGYLNMDFEKSNVMLNFDLEVLITDNIKNNENYRR